MSGDALSSSSCDTDTPSNSNQSAAALCVGVGSFSDPKDLQGLAHFLEHSNSTIWLVVIITANVNYSGVHG